MNTSLMRLLIDQALARRDDAATRATAARRDRDAAATTLATLTGYREESLQRGPVRAGQALGVEQLRTAVQFDARLIAAIRQQHGQHAARQADAAARDTDLVESQRRLKALETLAQRRAQARHRVEARREQRMLDEYATNLSARRVPGKDPR
jgi:flagellar FliJ protein